jgi:hypothetical protein
MMILLMVVKYSPNSYLACQIGQLCPNDFSNAMHDNCVAAEGLWVRLLLVLSSPLTAAAAIHGME